jgi:serine/threonine protein kinase
MAPELFEGEGSIYDEKIDVFAVGCAFFVLVAGRQHLTPFDPSKAPLAFPELFDRSDEFAVHFTSGGMLNEYGEILSAMTHRDPAHRKSAKELLVLYEDWLSRG